MKNTTSNQKTFKLSDSVSIDCETYETRYSWGHKAYLIINGSQEGYKKATYYNRTWESYTYQSVLFSLIESVNNKLISKEDKAKYQSMIKNDSFSQDKDALKSVAMVAMMGDIFGKTQKESNDWKARMLKAGLSNKGLIMPEDWESLSENDKQARLDGVIKTLNA